MGIKFSDRQYRIIKIVKKNQPITSEQIANKLNLTRATLRPDLSILTMTGILEARPKVGYFHTGRMISNTLLQYVNTIKVKDFKTRPMVVEVDTSVYDSIVTIFLEDIGSLFVQSEGYLAGVVSRKDFIKHAIGTADLTKLPVNMIMTRMPNIIMLEDNETVADAIIKMIEHEVDCMPVVEKQILDNKGKYIITGRVSKTTIIRAIYEMLKV